MKQRCDYKPVNRRQRRQTVRVHGVMVIGLVVIALGSGLVVHLRNNASPVPQVEQSAVAATISAAPALEQQPAAAREALTPKYNFYNELPKRQVAVP